MPTSWIWDPYHCVVDTGGECQSILRTYILRNDAIEAIISLSTHHISVSRVFEKIIDNGNGEQKQTFEEEFTTSLHDDTQEEPNAWAATRSSIRARD